MISIGFGGALSAVPTGVPVITRSPAARSLESGQRLQRLHRLVDHVAADDHVLPDLAVDPQLQPQIAEALELVGVQQHQCGPDGVKVG